MYKKIPHNKNAIEVDGKIVLSFNPRYEEYLKWRDENPELENQLVDELEKEIERKRLYNNGAPHIKGNVYKWYTEKGHEYIVAEMAENGHHYHGEVIQYRMNGKLKSKETFSNGVQAGEYEYYHKNGKLRQSGCIRNNIKDGEIKSYWETGTPQSLEVYKNGIREGRLLRYRLEGTLLMEGEYKNGYKDGTWNWYYSNNQKKKTEEYKELVLVKVTEWLSNGVKTSEKSYHGGLLHGVSTFWYKNRLKKQKVTYKNNRLYGKWTEWNFNGQKTSEGNMKFGVMNGIWNFW